MDFKLFLISVFASFFFLSCSEDNDVSVSRNLQEYIESSSTKDLGEVVAFAASASGSTSLSYIFYYPEKGATDIRYYEADSLDVDEKDFSNYKRQILAVENVFGGKLQRFSRSNSDENWCLITYEINGKLHKSNPIRLKNATKSTIWTDKVTIEFPNKLTPRFIWTDQGITGNETYFQVITEEEEETFLSGTFTHDTFLEYLDTTNVVADINEEETPESLVEDKEYLFTMMGISEDNWVNLVIQETFIPRNLEEYLDIHSTKTIEVATAFAASASANLSYIYYYPLFGTSDMRYYETESTSVDENDFSKYRRKNLSDEAVFGGKLRRYSRTNSQGSWSIITFVIGDLLYKSNPIKIKIDEKPTEWFTDENVTIDTKERLKPTFTWIDGSYNENESYFQIFTNNTGDFLSGTFTVNKTFQYYDISNTISNINTENPPELIFDSEYKFTVMGLSTDNWVNLMIQQSFIAE